MSIAALPTYAPTSYPPSVENPDADFERRWTAWTARGVARERAGRRRALIVAIVTAVIAVGALVAYGLLSA